MVTALSSRPAAAGSHGGAVRRGPDAVTRSSTTAQGPRRPDMREGAGPVSATGPPARFPQSSLDPSRGDVAHSPRSGGSLALERACARLEVLHLPEEEERRIRLHVAGELARREPSSLLLVRRCSRPWSIRLREFLLLEGRPVRGRVGDSRNWVADGSCEAVPHAVEEERREAASSLPGPRSGSTP